MRKQKPRRESVLSNGLILFLFFSNASVTNFPFRDFGLPTTAPYKGRRPSTVLVIRYIRRDSESCPTWRRIINGMTLCHNEQTAVLLLYFGFGHVLQYTPFILNFSALHFTHSYTTLEGVPKFCISTHPLWDRFWHFACLSWLWNINYCTSPYEQEKSACCWAPPLRLNAYETFAAYRLFDNIDSGRYLRADGFCVADDAHLSTLFAL